MLPAREVYEKDYSYVTHNIVTWIKMIRNSKSHSEFIVEYPLQQWLRERITILCVKYIAYFVILCIEHSLEVR